MQVVYIAKLSPSSSSSWTDLAQLSLFPSSDPKEKYQDRLGLVWFGSEQVLNAIPQQTKPNRTKLVNHNGPTANIFYGI